MDEELEIDGVWPDFENGILEELLCYEMWHKGKLEEPANVIFLKVSGNWYRLYFDYGIIFWRKDKEGPKEYEIPEYESYFKVVDVGRNYGLVNNIIESVVGRTLPNYDSAVIIKMANEKSIAFSNIDDNTTYRTY
jgi:hypothetical protein